MSANGKPGKAVFLNNNPEAAKILAEHAQMLEQIRSADMSSRLMLIKSFAEREELGQILEYLLDQEHAKAISSPQNFKNVQLYIDALNGLRANFNKKMILERLFLGIK